MTNYWNKRFCRLGNAIPSALLFLAFSSGLVAQTAEPDSETVEIEEATVVGQHPGPALWRVENGSNTLWIMGLMNPMPKSLEWDTVRVERVISESEAFISAPMVRSSPRNPFHAISVNRKVNKLRKLPEDQSLSDLLALQLLEDYLQAKELYAPKASDFEESRPLFVADRLFREAMGDVGVVMRSDVHKELEKMAKRQKIPITEIRINVPVEDAIEALKHISIDMEVECLETTLAMINNELQSSVERALAWSTGGAAAKEVLEHPPVNCFSSLIQADDSFKEARLSTREQWLNAVIRALETNTSTFTYLSMRELVEPEGLLAELLSRGYTLAGQ